MPTKHEADRSADSAYVSLWALALALIAGVNVFAGIYRSIRVDHAMDLQTVAAWSAAWGRGVNVYADAQAGVDYPPWALVVLWPLSLVSDSSLRVAWTLVNVALAVGLLAWLLTFSGARTRGRFLFAVLFAAVGCLRVLNQFSLLSYLLAVVGAITVSPAIGGVALGLSLIKPQIGGVVVVWVALQRGWRRIEIASAVVVLFHVVYAMVVLVSPTMLLRLYLSGLSALYSAPTELYGHTELRPWLWPLWPTAVGNMILTASLAVALFLPALCATRHVSLEDRGLELLAFLGVVSLLTVRHLSYDFILVLPALVAWRTIPFGGQTNHNRALFYTLAALLILGVPSWARAVGTYRALPGLALLVQFDRVMCIAMWLILASRLNRPVVKSAAE